jgi:hypothetical protein
MRGVRYQSIIEDTRGTEEMQKYEGGKQVRQRDGVMLGNTPSFLPETGQSSYLLSTAFASITFPACVILTA